MEWYLAVLMFAASTTITPGPNNVMIMSSGVNFGVRRSVPHWLGIAIGFPLMVAAVGMGFSALFTLVPQLHLLIQIVGIIYLLYLAWLIANSAEGISNSHSAKPFSFIQAALFQWVNPKAWVMATGAIGAYTSIEANFSAQVAVIALAFFAVAIPCVGAWLWFGAMLSRLLNQPIYRRRFNLSMALLLVLSIIPSVIELLTALTG